MRTRPAKRAEYPEGDRVPDEDPELPLLDDRRSRGRPGHDRHDANLAEAELELPPGRTPVMQATATWYLAWTFPS